MAGNGLVLKPAALAALAGERIGRIFARAGLPEGLLRIVHGHADAGRALVASPAPPTPVWRSSAPRSGRSASPGRWRPAATSARPVPERSSAASWRPAGAT